jgi:hypothetical protein
MHRYRLGLGEVDLQMGIHLLLLRRHRRRLLHAAQMKAISSDFLTLIAVPVGVLSAAMATSSSLAAWIALAMIGGHSLSGSV